MRVPAAYVGVILVWATTPLAIKWSGEGPGFIFGVASRMTIGTICVLLLLGALRQSLPFHRGAILTYLAGAVQIYGAMLAVYWSSQFIPSGWISVVFGVTPLLTALLAAAFLGEKSLGVARIMGYLLGIAGLEEIFGSALTIGPAAALGIGGVLLSALLQSGSAVWIKRIDAGIPALQVVAGSLLVALPAYLATWWLLDGRWPEVLPTSSWLSILYLGVVATTIGFALYFFVLQRLGATRVAMVSLVSPVLALFVGHLANHEPLSPRILIGTGLIVAALMTHALAGVVRRPLPVGATPR
jgi:drug/metabolite transporter (DMT)-like permease